jgi:hypothetical protein
MIEKGLLGSARTEDPKGQAPAVDTRSADKLLSPKDIEALLSACQTSAFGR